MTHKRWLAPAAAAILVAGAGPAAADPSGPDAETVRVTCGNGLGTQEVILNGNGDFSPGHVTSSTQVGIPYEFHFTGTFTPTGGAPQPIDIQFGHPAPQNGRLATCTFHEEEPIPEGWLSLDVTVNLSLTPAH